MCWLIPRVIVTQHIESALGMSEIDGLNHSLNASLIEARTSCVKRPLNKKLWNDLELNDYLRTYTGGSTLTLVVRFEFLSNIRP